MTQANYNNIVISILIFLTLLGIMLTLHYYLDNNSQKQEIILENKNNRQAEPLTDPTSPTKQNQSLSVTPVVAEQNPENSNVQTPTNPRLFGVYLAEGESGLSNFEKKMGREVNLFADFRNWQDKFPTYFSKNIGQKDKILVIFWEPSFGYDQIIDGSHDEYIKSFAKGAQQYSYPVILVPFAEMNLNEEAWGYGINNNSAEKFIKAWRHIHELFQEAPNVLFGLAYNNISIPEIAGNSFADYYPGDSYVDYLGVDGFSFNDNWQDFDQIFDQAIWQLNSYRKPILIFSMAAEANPQKASWILEGLGSHIKSYKNVMGFIWFNQHDTENWLIDSDPDSLKAFRSILP